METKIKEAAEKRKRLTLNSCSKGDILISKHGKAFICSHKDKSRSYPHIIHDAITGVECSRLNNGWVFGKLRLLIVSSCLSNLHLF